LGDLGFDSLFALVEPALASWEPATGGVDSHDAERTGREALGSRGVIAILALLAGELAGAGSSRNFAKPLFDEEGYRFAVDEKLRVGGVRFRSGSRRIPMIAERRFGFRGRRRNQCPAKCLSCADQSVGEEERAGQGVLADLNLDDGPDAFGRREG
jgi:hypothetical protein